MGPSRSQRLLVVALGVLFAGVLALPAKLGANDGMRLATTAPSIPLPTTPDARVAIAPVAPPPVERPIQAPDQPGPPGLPGSSAALADQFVVPATGPLPPPPPRLAVAHGAVTPESSKVYGVVVGINDYPGTASDLHGAVADANDMTDAMAMYGVPESNTTELVDGTATAPEIVHALQWLVASTAPDSTAVFFYAGHVRKVSDQTEAIVASDGTMLPDWYLGQQLSSLPAKKVWIVMATCYGGGFTELLAPGRVLTAAADANSIAYENESFGRSYLDEFLVHEGLLEQRAGLPTAQAAFLYAQSKLQQQYPNRTLTEIDDSTEQISLDGVHRGTDATTPAPPPPQGGGPLPGGGPSPAPAPSPPSAPAPCKNLLGLFCPPGSR